MALILAIDTSCDETSAAVVDGTRVLSNVISSQIAIHKKYGGVYPSLARRAHEEKIDWVIKEALRRAAINLNSKHEARNSKQNILNSNSLNSKRFENSDFENWKIVSDFGFRISDLPLQAVAVTYGPGLAIALEVGIRKAKELAVNWKWEDRSEKLEMKREVGSEKSDNPEITPLTSTSSFPSHISHIPLIAVNHLEGHIYSCLAETWKCEDRSEKLDMEVRNRKWKERNEVGSGKSDNPKITPLTSTSSFQHPISHLQFPALCLIISGGHTELVLMKNHGDYQILGATLDDACGEALDKAAKILKLGYPGGPIIERLAEECHPVILVRPKAASRIKERGLMLDTASMTIRFTPPMQDKTNLNFSYSGLKTQLLYLVQKMPEEEFSASLRELAFAFQAACFDQIIRKARQAIEIYHPKTIISGGGVIANKTLRRLIRRLGREYKIPTLFPPKKNLITDNAAMIGIAASFKYLRNEFVEDLDSLDRKPRLSL